MAMATATLATSPPLATVVPAPVPMAMAVDIELLASEVWPSCVGEWRTRAPVQIPGMPCCVASSTYTYDALNEEGVYPFQGVTTVRCCAGCCRVLSDQTTGQVSGDGSTLTATNGEGHTSRGTVESMDAREKRVTYQLTGTSAQGPISGTAVVEPGRWTDTVHTGGRTMVFVYEKTA